MTLRNNIRRNGRVNGGKLGKAQGGVDKVLRSPAPGLPLLWCELAGFVPGHTVRVYLSSPESCPKLKGAHGVTFDAKNGGVEIHLDAACPEDVQQVTLMHELLHCAVWGRSQKSCEGEERWAERFAPGLLEGLQLMGFTFPVRPNEKEI